MQARLEKCEPAQQNKIAPAMRKAHAWVTRALPALDAFLAGTKTKAAQAAGSALQTHFHSTEPTVATYVKQRLATIQGDIFGRESLRLVCPPHSDRECLGASVAAVVPKNNPNEIDFCEAFFAAELSDDDRAGTIVHEVGHAQLGLHAKQHMIDREYAKDAYYPYMTTGEALTNADSYAMFVQNVATGSSPARDFIEDKGLDCPESWIPTLFDAVTKARMWNRQASRHSGVGHRFRRVFIGAGHDLEKSQTFKCVPDGGGRCSNRNVAYWYAAGDLRICPTLVNLRTPDERALALLASLYAYTSRAEAGDQAAEAAREARRLHAANVPATRDVLQP